MPIIIEAVYEDGVLKPVRPLPLQDHEKVLVTVHTGQTWVERTAGIIPCADPQVIEWAAQDPDLEYPPPPEAP
jgi:predicted DNA-binding antitoxin AbrB/MazE fold protein